MKVYSIGRESGCTIVLTDNTNVISRRHAELYVSSLGKMTIIDSSHNGTYVNGVRIKSGIPYPVTRKDNVSFAHVAPLDWSRVENPQFEILKYTLLAIASLLLLVLLVWGGVKLFSKQSATETPSVADTEVPMMPCDEKTEKAIDSNKQPAKTDEEIRKQAEADAQAKIKERKAKKEEEQKNVGSDNKNNGKSGNKTDKKDNKNENKTETKQEENTGGPSFGM